MMTRKKKLLFLCTGNSCRSQMAEGWTRHLQNQNYDVWSAGIETHGLNPNAVKVMDESGVDISDHQSNNVTEYANIEFDYVITVCGHAHEHCPVFLGRAKVLHAGFDDPPKLVRDAASEQETLIPYRRVRDEIRDFVQNLPDFLSTVG